MKLKWNRRKVFSALSPSTGFGDDTTSGEVEICSIWSLSSPLVTAWLSGVLLQLTVLKPLVNQHAQFTSCDQEANEHGTSETLVSLSVFFQSSSRMLMRLAYYSCNLSLDTGRRAETNTATTY